jgi:hypothetical protein
MKGAPLSVTSGNNMMEFLGALVVIGIFVCWCDVADAWTTVLRSVQALSLSRTC